MLVQQVGNNAFQRYVPEQDRGTPQQTAVLHEEFMQVLQLRELLINLHVNERAVPFARLTSNLRDQVDDGGENQEFGLEMVSEQEQMLIFRLLEWNERETQRAWTDDVAQEFFHDLRNYGIAKYLGELDDPYSSRHRYENEREEVAGAMEMQLHRGLAYWESVAGLGPFEMYQG